MNWGVAFVTTQFFETINKKLGLGWSFWMFALVSLAGLFFVYFCVPETKGKTLEEIQGGFQ